MMSMGIALARILGFIFSFILARAFTPEDFGFTQYVITLANVVAIGTMPFGQHVMAWFISTYKSDHEKLDLFVSNSWFIMLVLFLGTFVIGIPILAATNNLTIGVLVIFVGFTFFYTYFGIARGFLASKRLLASYLGSNIVQMIAVVLAIMILGDDAVTPALLIYGLSYFLPIILLQVIKPLPIKFQLRKPDFQVVKRLLKFSTPVWISHASYMLYLSLDIILVETFWDNATVGVYALTKTMTATFSFIPWGITMLLMPKVAETDPSQHRTLLKNALGLTGIVNGAVFVGFVIFYEWFITQFFDATYFVGLQFGIAMAASAIMVGVHGIVTSVLVGSNHPEMESISRMMVAIVTFISGMILVPELNVLGAALATLIGTSSGMVTYGVIFFWRWLNKRYNIVPKFRKRKRSDLTD